MTKWILATLCLFVGAALLVALWFFETYNHLIELRQDIDAQWAEVENQYQRRADLIPNLVQTVAASAKFEQSTLVAVAQARANVGRVTLDADRAPTDAAKLREFQEAQESLGHALARLLVISEQYPDLKASENFTTLQVQLEGTENRIAYARYNFNLVTWRYDVAIQSFPSNICAHRWGFVPHPYFAAQENAENVPEVKFPK